jgi:DNA-binding HxlR family transcriptional regulator
MLLLKVIRIAWKTKTVPRQWNIAIIVLIYKKGDNRCISLLRIPRKIYERTLESRLRSVVEDQQFNPGHSELL